MPGLEGLGDIIQYQMWQMKNRGGVQRDEMTYLRLSSMLVLLPLHNMISLSESLSLYLPILNCMPRPSDLLWNCPQWKSKPLAQSVTTYLVRIGLPGPSPVWQLSKSRLGVLSSAGREPTGQRTWGQPGKSSWSGKSWEHRECLEERAAEEEGETNCKSNFNFAYFHIFKFKLKTGFHYLLLYFLPHVP